MLLKKVKDVPRILARLANLPGNFKAQGFRLILESLSSLIMLRDSMSDLFSKVSLITANPVLADSLSILHSNRASKG